jgi:hypothetical protein
MCRPLRGACSIDVPERHNRETECLGYHFREIEPNININETVHVGHPHNVTPPAVDLATLADRDDGFRHPSPASGRFLDRSSYPLTAAGPDKVRGSCRHQR